MPEKSAVLMESQAVQESLALPGSDIHLVYHSSRAKGYKSIIQLQLTPDEVPKSLAMVRVKITIEGVVHEKVFEADPNIQYTYAWDRLNEYRQVRKNAQASVFLISRSDFSSRFGSRSGSREIGNLNS